MKRSLLPVFIILAVIILDQVLKFHIKTNYFLREEHAVLGLQWFKIHFTENEGMAFGWSFGGKAGKLALTLFRIIAVSFIGYYLVYLVKRLAPIGLLISISLVFAGAMGNIIDSVFYGMIFSESTEFSKATFMPEDGGYSGLFYGNVVDMLYFPLSKGYYPSWIPGIGGDYYIFFRPVFNLADSAITIGVLSVLLFQRRYFLQKEEVGLSSTDPVAEVDSGDIQTEADPNPS